MSETPVIETEKKTKRVVKKIIVKRVIKSKKKDVESECEGESKPSEPQVATHDPVVSEKKDNVNADADPVDKYVDSMDEMTRKAMEIAKDHLESSFNLNKCNGYLSSLESTA